MNNVLGKNDVKVVKISERSKTKYQRIHTNDLYYGNYQRVLQTSWVNNLAKNFDEGLLGVLIVSYRDGKYYVIDGQHRLEAAKRSGIEELVCQVHIGLSYKDEAALFNKYNRERKGLSPWDVYKAELEAGDETVLKISEIVESHRFKVASSGGKTAINGIIAIAMLKDIFKKEGEDNLDRVLRLIRATWDDEKVSLQRNILGGMAIFIRLYGEDFTDEEFIDKFGKIHPDVIVRDGRRDAEYSQSSKITIPYAKAIWRLYNKSKRTNKLEDKFVGKYR